MTTAVVTNSVMDPNSGSLTDSAVVLYPHRRQFVIGPQAFDPNVPNAPAWKSHAIAENFWLSYSPTLPIQHCVDADGESWWLLGLAVSGWAEGDTPAAAIARTATSNVPDLYGHWAGRWLLIGHGQIHLDASGLLGCFYGSDADGNHWASSSPALMSSMALTRTLRARLRISSSCFRVVVSTIPVSGSE